MPHILIRYYTVKDQASARKSTIVGIASIGFFYVLTLYIGLGAMTSGALDVTNSNMAAPLLAKSFSEWLFAVISAIAFTTVLGTVSGLIIAASGAVAHDICGTLLKMEMTDTQKIRIAKIASVVVGLIAIVLGILFEKMNVSYLVGWAFSVAASANLPSLIMLIFWKGTTKQGITAAITVGVISSLSWILLTAEQSMRTMRSMMERIKLTVNEQKTKLCRVPAETFDFLGYTFGRCYSPKTGRAYLGTRPSRKKVQKLCEAISEQTGRNKTLQDVTEIVDRLNRQLRGWANYFRLGPVSKAYRAVDHHVTNRLRQWLRAKHQEPSRGTTRFPDEYLYQTLGLIRLSLRTRNFPWATRLNNPN